MKPDLALQYPAAVLAQQLISAAVDWFARSPAIHAHTHEEAAEHQRLVASLERCRANAQLGIWL